MASQVIAALLADPAARCGGRGSCSAGLVSSRFSRNVAPAPEAGRWVRMIRRSLASVGGCLAVGPRSITKTPPSGTTPGVPRAGRRPARRRTRHPLGRRAPCRLPGHPHPAQPHVNISQPQRPDLRSAQRAQQRHQRDRPVREGPQVRQERQERPSVPALRAAAAAGAPAAAAAWLARADVPQQAARRSGDATPHLAGDPWRRGNER